MNRAIIILAGVFAGVSLCLNCSTGSSDLAGGAGSGNPGVTALVIRVDTTAALQKPRTTAQVPAPGALATAIDIHDPDTFTISVTKAQMVVRRIRYVLDRSQPCDEIGARVTPPFTYESGSIILDSTFICDVLAGTTTPVTSAITLPPARYTALEVTIAPTAVAGATPVATDSFSTDIAGTFQYHDTARTISVRLADINTTLYYDIDTIFTVTPGDTTRLLLALDARQWLAGCRIENGLNNGGLLLNEAGNLVIFDSTGTKECANLGRRIAVNIMASGSLKNQK